MPLASMSKLDFDLRHTPRSGSNSFEVELTEQPVVGRHFAFALEDADGNRSLVVVGRAKGLLALGRHGRVTLHELGKDSAQSLDTQAQRGNVQEQHVLHFTRQHAALDGSTDGHDFVGIHALVGLFVEDLANELLHLRDTRRTTDQHDFVDFAGLQLGILQSPHHRPTATLDQTVDKLLKLGAGDVQLQMLRSAGIGRDEGQIDVGRSGGAEFFLGFLASFLQTLQGHRVLAEVDALLFLEFVRDVIDQHLIEVVATEVRITIGADDAKDAVGHFENRNVKRAAAKIEDDDLLGLFLVEAIG